MKHPKRSIPVLQGNYSKTDPSSVSLTDKQDTFKGEQLYSRTINVWQFDTSTYRQGVRNPSFRSMIKKKIDASSPYKIYSAALKVHPYNGSYKIMNSDKPNVVDWTGTYVNNSYVRLANTVSKPLTFSFPTTENMARSNAWSKIDQSAKMGEFIGEFRETVEMLRNPVMSLYKGVSDFASFSRTARNQLKSQGASPRRYAKLVSNAWLAYSFGWKPLIQTVYAAYDAIMHFTDSPKFHRFIGQASDYSSVGKTYLGEVSASPLIMKVYYTQHIDYMLAYIGAAKAVAKTVTEAKLGIWPLDFVATAWELVPFSFLVDYFTTIGDVLNSSAAFDRNQLAYCNRREKAIVTTQVYIENSSHLTWPGIDTTRTPFASSEIKFIYYNRSLSTMPIPFLDLRVNLSPTRLLNLTALSAKFL